MGWEFLAWQMQQRAGKAGWAMQLRAVVGSCQDLKPADEDEKTEIISFHFQLTTV